MVNIYFKEFDKIFVTSVSLASYTIWAYNYVRDKTIIKIEVI
jgi:hypothetical protein